METALKTALITGSSRGIGFKIAEKLASHGINICITGRQQESLDRAQALLKAHPSSQEVYTAVADLNAAESAERLIQEAGEKLGSIDLLINNAGISLNKPLEKTTIDEWNTIMNINARAPFFLCQSALPWLRKSATPTIIQISSVVGHAGYELQSAYAASKHALLGFTKAFAKEVQQDDIRIYTISPGGVSTEMIASVRPDLESDSLIEPQAISNLIWFILTNRGSAMVDHFVLRRVSKTPWA
ncbi:MAG: SDR family oxidoreductase [Sphaerochaetaceae bacterium]